MCKTEGCVFLCTGVKKDYCCNNCSFGKEHGQTCKQKPFGGKEKKPIIRDEVSSNGEPPQNLDVP